MNLGGVIHLNRTGICVLFSLIVICVLYSMSESGDNISKEIKRVSLGKLLNVAVKAAENGGTKVVSTKDNIDIHKKGLTKEGVVDSVTTADFLSHCVMIDTFKQVFPSIKIISEEAETVCRHNKLANYSFTNTISEEFLEEEIDENDIAIWIDPLDATKEYTEKLYHYVTTMVCITVKNKPLIGVIHKPFSNSTFWAWDNKATSTNLKNSLPKVKENNFFNIIVSKSHRGKIEEQLQESFKEKYKLIIAAGAGFKALEVAAGRADAYLHITAIKKWDICAGNAIINSLGGKMTNKFNKEIDYSEDSGVLNENGLIASLKNHEVFLKIFSI